MFSMAQRSDGRWSVYKDGVLDNHWSYGSKGSAQRYIRQQQRPAKEKPMNLIGISGKAESGKDLATGIITTVYPRHYYRRGFADALKRDALAAWLHGSADVPAWPQDRVLEEANKLKEQSLAFRTFLQDFGQVKRNGNPMYWIDRLFRDHQATELRYTGLATPDVRYKNEAEEVLARGGLVLRLERPGHENRLTPEQRLHISETDLDDWPESENYRILENTGDPLALLQLVLGHVRQFNHWSA